jgi:hypothetical protein
LAVNASAEFLATHPKQYLSANYFGARMSDRIDWVNGLSTEELVFAHKVYELINETSCATIESHRATAEIREELCRRDQLTRLEKDLNIG